MKIRIAIAISALLLASPVFAASTDVTLTPDTVISSGGASVSISGSNSAVESITVNTSNFVVVLPNTSHIEMSANKKLDWSASANTLSIIYECSGTSAHMTVVNNSGSAVTLTVTPSSSECGSSSGSSGGSGGNGPISGGGAGGGYVPAITPAPTTTITVTVPGASQTQVTVPVTVGTTFAFTRSLYLGLSGADVTELQRVLALDATLYPEGMTSGYFGGLTQKAVQRFQEKYGITGPGLQGYGVFGPATRAKFASVYGISTAMATPAGTVSSGALTVSLRKGMTHVQVKLLQQILNKDPETQVAASGVGSAGYETDYFGGMTEKAVMKFQAKYGIEAIGLVGPMTRAKLNSI
ncbi:MAG TPA: peptidoglycan-binding protein [Candidatus Paceibacterota bacterium]